MISSEEAKRRLEQLAQQAGSRKLASSLKIPEPDCGHRTNPHRTLSQIDGERQD